MINNLKIGDTYDEKWSPSYDDLKAFSKLSGDYNPIHLNIDDAKKLGKKDLIVHGNLGCAILSKIIGMNFPGNGSLILEQNISFPNPIYPKDIININLQIRSANYELRVIDILVRAFKLIKDDKLNKTIVLRGNILCQIS